MIDDNGDVGSVADLLYNELLEAYGSGQKVGVDYVKSRAKDMINQLEVGCEPNSVLIAMKHLGVVRRKKEYIL